MFSCSSVHHFMIKKDIQNICQLFFYFFVLFKVTEKYILLFMTFLRNVFKKIFMLICTRCTVFSLHRIVRFFNAGEFVH